MSRTTKTGFQIVFQRTLKEALMGDPDAQYNIGAIYFEGTHRKKNPVIAMRYMERSAAQGDSDAQNFLGTIYEEGEDVEQDFVAAAKWYIKADAQNNEDAAHNLKSLFNDLMEGVRVGRSAFSHASQPWMAERLKALSLISAYEVKKSAKAKENFTQGIDRSAP